VRSEVRNVLEVAHWEFFRLFKWKDLLIGPVVFLGFAGLMALLGGFLGGSRRDVKVAVVSELELPAPAPGSRLKLRRAPEAQLESLRRQVWEGDLTGLLVVPRSPSATAELFVMKEPRYESEIVGLLSEVRRRQRLEERSLSKEDLDTILRKAELKTTYHEKARGPKGRAEKIAAAVVVGLVVILALTGLSQLLVGITGEKQQRVCELVVSAVTPQAWIDGKILGIAAYSLVNTLTLAVGAVVVPLSLASFLPITMPTRISDPFVVVALALVALLGVLMWNCFFAAVAATINDPNTSSKGPLLFLPIFPVVLSLFVIDSPDAVSSRVMAIFPLTSPATLPVRLVLSDPGLLETGAALGLLALTVLLFRRLAGRIFEVGMLMYGKEPTLPEIWRVAFELPARRGVRRSLEETDEPSR
jgi:ABC-2 type transport system permease protein